MTKLNEQHQFDLPYVAHNVFERNTCKYWLVSVDAGSRYKTARLLRAKKTSDVAFWWKQYIRRVVCLNTRRL